MISTLRDFILSRMMVRQSPYQESIQAMHPRRNEPKRFVSCLRLYFQQDSAT